MLSGTNVQTWRVPACTIRVSESHDTLRRLLYSACHGLHFQDWEVTSCNARYWTYRSEMVEGTQSVLGCYVIATSPLLKILISIVQRCPDCVEVEYSSYPVAGERSFKWLVTSASRASCQLQSGDDLDTQLSTTASSVPPFSLEVIRHFSYLEQASKDWSAAYREWFSTSKKILTV